MSVWTRTAGNQLHKHRLTLKREDKKRVLVAWMNLVGRSDVGSVREATRERFLQKGADACALLTLKVQRTAMKRAITRDLTACLVSEANDAGAKGDVSRVFAITKKLKSGHDNPHKVIRDESGVLLVEDEMVAARWRRHWAELLQRQAGNDCQCTRKTARWKGTNEPGHSA